MDNIMTIVEQTVMRITKWDIGSERVNVRYDKREFKYWIMFVLHN